MLAIELVDELVDGATSAAWPAIRADLALDYAQVGLLLTIPALVGHFIEPAIGILGDIGHRRRLILGGAVGFTLALALYAASWSFGALLVASTVFSPSSGAFVGLAQATLMDLDPRRHAQSMARWTLAGSLGGVCGAVLVTLATRLGYGWRGALLAIAVIAVATVAAFVRTADAMPALAAQTHGRDPSGSLAALARGAVDALRALHRREVVRWVVLLQCSDLMLDILHGFLALYLVDVAGVELGQAALGVAIWIGVGLLGDALLIPLLERVDGVRWLRVSATLTAALYAAFLLVPGFAPRLPILAALGLLKSGWYAVLQAGLYSAMPGRSATVLALNNVGGIGGSLFPLSIGLVASRFGLDVAMWILLAGPVALFVGLPRATPASVANDR